MERRKWLNQLKNFVNKHCKELLRPMFEIHAEPTFFEHFLNISFSLIAYLEANMLPKHRYSSSVTLECSFVLMSYYFVPVLGSGQN
jgi:hypothetical protein